MLSKILVKEGKKRKSEVSSLMFFFASHSYLLNLLKTFNLIRL